MELNINNLDVSFSRNGREAHVLRGIDLTVRQGEIHALVGESGSGKTVTSLAVMGLLPAHVVKFNDGKIMLEGKNILVLPEKEQRSIRGQKIAMVFQEPSKYLNPTLKVGEQITEVLELHLGMNKKAAVERALEILGTVGLGNGRRVLHSYPHELSGGMKQRAMIAIAISCNPSFLIADEPTTALDVTLQLQILELILSLREKLSMGVLFISHDLRVVHDISDRISVIYAGKIIEHTTKNELFSYPIHPYTQLLLQSIPDADKRGSRLVTIPGKVPDAEDMPTGCAFHPRCPMAKELCSVKEPEMKEYAAEHFAACHYCGIE